MMEQTLGKYITYKKYKDLLNFLSRQSQFVFNQTSNEQTDITFLNYNGNTLYVRVCNIIHFMTHFTL